jgi:hypothetical protein
VADPTAYLEGGPCNGTLHAITPNEADSGEIICKGGLYKNPEQGAHSHGGIVFKYAGKVPSTKPAITTPQALKGWQSLRKSINRGMPSALDYSQHRTTAALRELRRARKVRV